MEVDELTSQATPVEDAVMPVAAPGTPELSYIGKSSSRYKAELHFCLDTFR
jgi:hypothetical protein